MRRWWGMRSAVGRWVFFVAVAFWMSAAVAGVARADIFRCADSSGRLRFVNAATDCDGAHEVIVKRADEETSPASQAAASVAPAERRVDLAAQLLTARECGPDCDTIDEASEPIDVELRQHGLVDTATRHYSQASGRTSEVCSIELWQFDQPQSAQRVESSLALPNWLVLRAGSLLVLAHGVRLELGLPSDGRLRRACADLGRRTHARITQEDTTRRH